MPQLLSVLIDAIGHWIESEEKLIKLFHFKQFIMNSIISNMTFRYIYFYGNTFPSLLPPSLSRPLSLSGIIIPHNTRYPYSNVHEPVTMLPDKHKVKSMCRDDYTSWGGEIILLYSSKPSQIIWDIKAEMLCSLRSERERCDEGRESERCNIVDFENWVRGTRAKECMKVSRSSCCASRKEHRSGNTLMLAQWEPCQTFWPPEL